MYTTIDLITFIATYTLSKINVKNAPIKRIFMCRGVHCNALSTKADYLEKSFSRKLFRS